MTFAAGNNATYTSLGRCEGAGHAIPRPHLFPRVTFLPARHLARAVILLGGACLSYSVAAQEVTVTPADDAIAVITIFNAQTAGVDEIITVDTPRGPVSLRYYSTPNGCGPECSADRVDVVSWPEGTLPSVVSLTIEERAVGTITLRTWEGM